MFNPGLVGRGADLNGLRCALESSISPSTRDALLGEWMVITNRVFNNPLDLRQTLFDGPFNNRLKEIITSDLNEIQA